MVGTFCNIYALISDGLVLYIGSTKHNLRNRELQHRNRKNICGSRDIPKDCEWKITLLEKCLIDKRKDREQFHYDKLKPLYNINKPKGESLTVWFVRQEINRMITVIEKQNGIVWI